MSAHAPPNASMATFQAGIHTPRWKQRKRFPVFILEVFACFLIPAPGNVNASGDASIVRVRHLVRLYRIVEVFVRLKTWLLAGVGLIRHAGRCPRRKSGVVDEEFDSRTTAGELLSFQYERIKRTDHSSLTPTLA